MKTPRKHRTVARWTPALGKLNAISIRQPWAWLVVNGFKDIENRVWGTHVRGRVLIHAGQNNGDFCDEVVNYVKKKYGVRVPDFLDLGGIVGVVEIVDCVKKHPSKWFRGPFGWVLANARPLPFRPCPGKLRFFTPDL